MRRVLPKDRLHLAEDRILFHRERMPDGYEESRHSNPIELLTIGIFAAHFVNTVSQNFLREIVIGRHDFVNLPLQNELKNKIVAVCNFDEQLEHHAYAAADFVLMPSKFEPCGLPQMIGLIYGALPVAHDTGGIHDTVLHLDADSDFGNGFLFETFDGNGLFWAIDQAMSFFMLPDNVKRMQIERIMRQSTETFNYRVTAKGYIKLYEKMLQHPVVSSAGH